MLRACATFLCPGGWLAIKVPNGPAQRVKETLRARLRPSYRATLADNLVHVNHFSAGVAGAGADRRRLSATSTVVAAAPELPGTAAAPAAGWGRLAAYPRRARAARRRASPLAFNLQAYGRRG